MTGFDSARQVENCRSPRTAFMTECYSQLLQQLTWYRLSLCSPYSIHFTCEVLILLYPVMHGLNAEQAGGQVLARRSKLFLVFSITLFEIKRHHFRFTAFCPRNTFDCITPHSSIWTARFIIKSELDVNFNTKRTPSVQTFRCCLEDWYHSPCPTCRAESQDEQINEFMHAHMNEADRSYLFVACITCETRSRCCRKRKAGKKSAAYDFVACCGHISERLSVDSNNSTTANHIPSAGAGASARKAEKRNNSPSRLMQRFRLRRIAPYCKHNRVLLLTDNEVKQTTCIRFFQCSLRDVIYLSVGHSLFISFRFDLKLHEAEGARTRFKFSRQSLHGCE